VVLSVRKADAKIRIFWKPASVFPDFFLNLPFCGILRLQPGCGFVSEWKLYYFCTF